MRLFVFGFSNSDMIVDSETGVEHVLSVAITAHSLRDAYRQLAKYCHETHNMSDDPTDYEDDVKRCDVVLDLPEVVPTKTKTYKVVRHYKDIHTPKETIKTGLTLAEAQEHCNDPSTSGDGWFDGFDEE